jgi:hypothetical protein
MFICRLIRRPEHPVCRHWYLPANWRSYIRWLPGQWVSQCYAAECDRSFYCALFCVFRARVSQCPISLSAEHPLCFCLSEFRSDKNVTSRRALRRQNLHNAYYYMEGGCERAANQAVPYGDANLGATHFTDIFLSVRFEIPTGLSVKGATF